MNAILRLAGAARVFPFGSDCVYWMTESEQGVWSRPHVGTLASLLAAPRSAAALLEHFPAGAERDSAALALDRMIRRGLVESASSPPCVAQFCRESGFAHQLLERNRWEKGATVRNLGAAAEGEALSQALTAVGLPIRDDGLLQVLAVTDYLDPRLESLHREWQRAGTPWILAKLAGAEVWLGPFFVPGRTACWRCLELRLRERAWLSSQLAPANGPLWTPYVSESRIRAAAAFAAQEIARWLLEAPGSLEGAIWSFSWANLQSGRHKVARLPNCPDCRTTPLESRPGRVKLGSAIAHWIPAAGTRGVSPQTIIDRLEPLTSPITGILRRLERRDLAPAPPVFAYGAVYNVALPPAALRMPDAIVQPGVCSGRGWTVDEAKAACLAEAVERYSLQFRGDEPRITARFRDLEDAAFHPNQVLLFSEAQFRHRETWNRDHGLDDAVPERFDESEEIEWSQGWSLTAQRPRFLPMALHSQYYRPPGRRWVGDADSNGCAAGSCFEEAILHGILELVERDALGIWWFNQVARPAYGAGAIRDPLCRYVCAQLQEQGWQVRVQNIATDLGIPVFVALAVRPGGWIRGAAAHLDAATALRQAICELWQLSKAPARPGSPPPYSGMDECALDTGSLEERDVDLNCLVEECCLKLSHAGHEVVVLDMTRPEIPFPVARVVSPGLRHAKPRFAPGRLYQAPVRLGWIERARTEEEMPAQPA